MNTDPTLSLRTRLRVSTMAKAAFALTNAGYKPNSRSELIRVSMEVFVRNLEISGKAPEKLTLYESYDLIREYLSERNEIERQILFTRLAQESLTFEKQAADSTLEQSLADAFRQARESIEKEEE